MKRSGAVADLVLLMLMLGGGALASGVTSVPGLSVADQVPPSYAWSGVGITLLSNTTCPVPNCQWAPPQISPATFSGTSNANGVVGPFIVQSFKDGSGTANNVCGNGAQGSHPVEWPPIFFVLINGQRVGLPYPQLTLQAGTYQNCGVTSPFSYNGVYWVSFTYQIGNSGQPLSNGLSSCLPSTYLSASAACYVMQVGFCVSSLGSCSAQATPPQTYPQSPTTPPAYTFGSSTTTTTTTSTSTTAGGQTTTTSTTATSSTQIGSQTSANPHSSGPSASQYVGLSMSGVAVLGLVLVHRRKTSLG